VYDTQRLSKDASVGALGKAKAGFEKSSCGGSDAGMAVGVSSAQRRDRDTREKRVLDVRHFFFYVPSVDNAEREREKSSRKDNNGREKERAQ